MNEQKSRAKLKSKTKAISSRLYFHYLQPVFKTKPTVLQILFTLSFLRTVFFSVSWTDFFYGYLLFEWIWLSFIANRSSRHPQANQYSNAWSKRIMVIALLSVFWYALVVIATMIISFPFGFWFVVFPSDFHTLMLLQMKVILLLSMLGHLILVFVNIKRILPDKSFYLSLAQVLIYPWGTFTILSELQQA
jgi:hypothetical protein